MAEALSTSIDARGMACPRPIIELAKLRRCTADGVQVVITADDLAFESDLKAWCETTGNRLVTFKRDADVVTAVIEFGRKG